MRWGSRRTFALLVACLLTVGGLLAVPRVARAGLVSLDVAPGAYSHPGLLGHPYAYVPNEMIDFRLVGDTGGEVFDAVVIVLSAALILQVYNDIVIPGALVVNLTYFVPTALPDGYDYQIEVGDANWIESNRMTTRYDFQPFAVQAYEVVLAVDRPAYIGGDTMTVSWLATNLADGSLAPEGYGQLWVYDTRGPASTLIAPSVFIYTEAAGNFTFDLPDLADPTFDGVVETWFNDTPANPIRLQRALAFFGIDYLGLTANLRAAEYPPGGLVGVDVRASATNNQADPAPTDPPEPGAIVDITVWELAIGGPVLRPQYGATGLLTDGQGNVSHLFRLDAGIPNGTAFEVRANASTPNGIWSWQATDTFVVADDAGFTLALTFDRPLYAPGITMIIHYVLAPRGPGTVLPPTLELEYGLWVGPRTRLGTSQAEGDATYALPPSIRDGAHPFSAREWSTLTDAQEDVLVDAIPPDLGVPAAEPAFVGEAIPVRVNASDSAGIAAVLLHWSFSDGSNGTIPMSEDTPGTYAAVVPPRAVAGALELFVTAEDGVGNSARTETVAVNITRPFVERPPAPIALIVAGSVVAVGAVVAGLILLRSRRARGPRRPESEEGRLPPR